MIAGIIDLENCTYERRDYVNINQEKIIVNLHYRFNSPQIEKSLKSLSN